MAREAASSPKSVLMLAFHFPPHGQSTGRLRTLSFVRHLPAEGWRPIVVTARAGIYSQVDTRTLKEIPPATRVIRAWGFDIARAVAIRGIYPRWLATPDRWSPWSLGALVSALLAVRAARPRILWATFPIPSALLAAYALHRLTRLPFVADLRDPLVYESWPESPWDRRVYQWLERRVVHAARAVVLTTPRACAMYRERYPAVADRFKVIANGVDDDAAPGTPAPPAVDAAQPITLIHSGLMESPDRDPTAFFGALRLLRDRALLPSRGLRVVLRASGREGQYRAAAAANGVDDLVEFAPAIPRDEAVRELSIATGLLLFQGPQCNRQIPAKAYEYLASGRPIIALAHPDGDTHALVKGEWRVPYVADMNTPEQIALVLAGFIADQETGSVFVPPAELRAPYSRRARATDLARLLDSLAGVAPTDA